MLPSQSNTAPSRCGVSVEKRIMWWSTDALSTRGPKAVACVGVAKGERNAKHRLVLPDAPGTVWRAAPSGAWAAKVRGSAHGSAGPLLGGVGSTVPHAAPVHAGARAATHASMTPRRVGGIGRATSWTRSPMSSHTLRPGAEGAARCVSAYVTRGIGAP